MGSPKTSEYSRPPPRCKRGDVGQFGQLLTQSHLSLCDDYEVSGVELDMLVDLSANTPGVLRARLTGPDSAVEFRTQESPDVVAVACSLVIPVTAGPA
jgi:hypothetical protein